MVLRRNIKAISGILLFLVIAISFSCEKRGFLIVDCTECYTEEPKDATLEIKLDAVFYLPTLIRIYEGNLEDSIIYRDLKTSLTKITVTVPVNNKYTVTAKYYLDGRYYIAVNSITPRVKYDKETCNDPCYYVYNKKVDLRLKYY
jgi:hypothetical protein